MILTNNDKLIEYLDLNLFEYLEEADQETFDNAEEVHGLATGFIDFKKKDIEFFGDCLITTIYRSMNSNIDTKHIDIFVLQIYEYHKVKKTYYIKPQDFLIPVEVVSPNLPNTERSENGSFPEFHVIQGF